MEVQVLEKGAKVKLVGICDRPSKTRILYFQKEGQFSGESGRLCIHVTMNWYQTSIVFHSPTLDAKREQCVNKTSVILHVGDLKVDDKFEFPANTVKNWETLGENACCEVESSGKFEYAEEERDDHEIWKAAEIGTTQLLVDGVMFTGM